MIEAYFASLRDLSFELKSTIEKGVYSGREGWIMEVSHIIVKKEGGVSYVGWRGRFWEGCRCLKWGYILGRRVDSVSVAYRCLKGGGYTLVGRGRLCERCI